MTFNVFLRTPPGAEDQQQSSRPSYSVIIFLLGITIALIAGRLEMGLGATSYEFAHQALKIAAGEGLGDYYQWPPGYAIVTAFLMKLGFAPLRGAWLISIVCTGGAAMMLYQLAHRITNRQGGILAALLFIANAAVLFYGSNSVQSEMLYIFSSLVALDFLERLCFGTDEKNVGRPRIWFAVITGIALALPFWIRYIGILFPLLGIGVCVILYVKGIPARRIELITTTVVTIIFGGMLMVRNVIFAESVAGHPTSGVPGETFSSAIAEFLWQLGGGLFWKRISPSPILKFAVVTSSASAIVILAAIGMRKLRLFILTSIPIAYMLLLAYVASHTRIDVIGWRFIFPILPFLILPIVLLWYWSATLLDVKPFVRRLSKGVITVFSGITFLSGSAMIVVGIPSSPAYSHETIEYVTTHVSKGTTIAGSRYGMQLLATTLDYSYIEIPFDDPGNAGYTEAYGVHLWTREKALRTFVEKDVRCVVFFLGSDHEDGFLERGAYGDYVRSLYAGNVPEVSEQIATADGRVIRLVDRDSLTSLVNRIK